MRPTRSNRIREFNVADDVRMDLMLTIELNAAPIDESLCIIAGAPNGSNAQRILVKNQPMLATRDASRTRIKSNRNSLVRKIERVTRNLIGMRQTWTIIHC